MCEEKEEQRKHGLLMQKLNEEIKSQDLLSQ